ncbi:MAG: glycosyltransferase family A protein [Desulfobacteraceae bacterium]
MLNKIKHTIDKKIRAHKIQQQFKQDLIPLKQEIESNQSITTIFEPKAVAVLLSYKRPKNLPLIAKTLLKLEFISKVIVSNNNPDLKMEKYFDFTDNRLELINQPQRRRAGFRFGIVKDMDAENYVFIDDDLFLKPSQIATLYQFLLDNPSVPHGIWGQQFIKEGDQYTRMEIIRNYNGELDVINRAYFLTHHHVKGFFKLLEAIEINDIVDLQFGDDMILSFTGKGRPICHDVGPLLDCPSKDADGIAIWRENDFQGYRGNLFSQLTQIRNSATSS